MKTLKRTLRRGEDAVIKVTKKIGKDKEVVTEKRKTVYDLPEHCAYVRVGGGMTKNLGDYQSARIDVSVSIPCHPTADAIDHTYEQASACVEDFLDREYTKVIGED